MELTLHMMRSEGFRILVRRLLKMVIMLFFYILFVHLKLPAKAHVFSLTEYFFEAVPRRRFVPTLSVVAISKALSDCQPTFFMVRVFQRASSFSTKKTPTIAKVFS